MQNIKSEDNAQYDVKHDAMTDDQVIAKALDILNARMAEKGIAMCSPSTVSDYCRLNIADKEHEIVGVLMLDNRHRLIEYAELFRGTIDGASVYPREVVKECLSRNTAAVIFTHNHPSGITEPSKADISITARLKAALALVDIRVLDHIIVGADATVSLAERGLV